MTKINKKKNKCLAYMAHEIALGELHATFFESAVEIISA
jgi:hypothetical protein